MNGAAPVVPNAMITPMATIASRMGISHHFLLCLRKSTNSATRPVRLLSASRENSSLCWLVLNGILRLELTEIAFDRLRWGSLDPICRCCGLELALQCVTTDQSEDKG